MALLEKRNAMALKFPRYPEVGHMDELHPATDTEARDLILRLNHFEWETHKVSGRFDRNPYALTATIDGQAHRIKLPGRFGGVLKWLDREERKRHVQEVL